MHKKIPPQNRVVCCPYLVIGAYPSWALNLGILGTFLEL